MYNLMKHFFLGGGGLPNLGALLFPTTAVPQYLLPLLSQEDLEWKYYEQNHRGLKAWLIYTARKKSGLQKRMDLIFKPI